MGKKTAKKVKKEVIVANAEPTLTTASEGDLKKAEAEPAEPELSKSINETPSAVVKSSKKSVEGVNIKRQSQGGISQHTKSIEKIVPPDIETTKSKEELKPKKKKKDSVDAKRIRESRDIRVSISEKNEERIEENEEVSEKGPEKPPKKSKSGKKGKKEKQESEDKEKIEKPKKAKAPAKPKGKLIDKATQKDKNEEMAVPAAESSGQIVRAESQTINSEKKQRSRVSIAKEAIKSEDTISKKRKKQPKEGPR
ncbi:muscle M-line assembly protein unc-89-like [Sitophilus oryzae]|uniref:Muscle M-line assembly protein unc-89-like n=1 Tax=Sitophilus oryzae TaxID=7048 RepID=A0A6J2Y374_SITOR|nr:muscle M-line assembly protein unc-89-like [Sitophilus oryzae]